MKLYDDILVTFSLEEKGLEGLVVDVLSYEESKKPLLPINMELTYKGIIKWLSNRVIPKKDVYKRQVYYSKSYSNAEQSIGRTAQGGTGW